MVSLSIRRRDSLEYITEDPDPRFSPRTWSTNLDSDAYDEHDPEPDYRPVSASQDSLTAGRRRKKRHSDFTLEQAPPFKEYPTIADGDLFRLCELKQGSWNDPIRCYLSFESSRRIKRGYRCLSYCWDNDPDSQGRPLRDAAILVDDFRFMVTKNLAKAMQCLRKPTTDILIWIDQLCINQDDFDERARQVKIMKHIFKGARKVVVWLGEEADRSKQLFEYAKKLGKGYHGQGTLLRRILPDRQLQDATTSLLQRRWFSRVWVIPEVALADKLTIACGHDSLSWENFTKLIRLTSPSPSTLTPHFDKQTSLLGNPRQRIAILSQMITSLKSQKFHTDITSLLILAKASLATDPRDFIYAFHGITLLSTSVDYRISLKRLYPDLAAQYVGSILYDNAYATWHGLSEGQRIRQVMSILYSAGLLNQDGANELPSWVPDWSFRWTLAPIWSKPAANLGVGAGGERDDWSEGIRSEFRAGGENGIEVFQVVGGEYGWWRLKISVLVFDVVGVVLHSEEEVVGGAGGMQGFSPGTPGAGIGMGDVPELRYGRVAFRTRGRLSGIAAPGVQVGDVLAIPIGGDVPVVLRACSDPPDPDPPPEIEGLSTYKLLCECLIESEHVMHGDLLAEALKDMDAAEVIVLT